MGHGALSTSYKRHGCAYRRIVMAHSLLTLTAPPGDIALAQRVKGHIDVARAAFWHETRL